MSQSPRLTRRSLAAVLAASAAPRAAAQEPPAPAPADDLARAREAIRAQGRALAAAAAKLPPGTEPAFRFEA
jgi:hypothetical protein